MSTLGPATLVRPGKGGPEIFIDKIFKLNGRNNKFETATGSFTATGCIIETTGFIYTYDATSGATPATLKRWSNEAKKLLKPGVKGIEVVGKVDGRGSLTTLPTSKLQKTQEFGGQGGVTSEGKLPANAATTRAQEKGSTYIFQRALQDNKTWNDVDDLKKDKVTMKKLNDIWQKEIKVNVNQTWLDGYWKQHVKMLQEFGNSTWSEFDHSGTTSFMDFISKTINKNFGISKKDTWNPADMWMIKGTTKGVVDLIEATIFGSKDSQTIEQLNSVMRKLYTDRELVGVSLKAISGKLAQFEEYNLASLTQEDVKHYSYPNIKLIINLTEDMTQDSKAELRAGGEGFNFQIKANTSTDWSGLKWESTPKGASAARGGKAEVDSVVALLDDLGQKFDKNWRNYPKDATEFKKNQTKWEAMFRRVNKGATTSVPSAGTFSANMVRKFMTGLADQKVANSKLMQLTFLDDVLKIKADNNKRYTEMWTDMVFLSIKKGDKYGPFGKLY